MRACVLAIWLSGCGVWGGAPSDEGAGESVAAEPSDTAEAPSAAAAEAEPSAPRQVCVVRHAESYINLGMTEADLPPGKLDTLTPDGQERARALLAELPAPIGSVLVSPTGRALHTAQLMELPAAVRPDAVLRPLVGDVPWEDRLAAAAEGRDLADDNTETFAQGAARAARALERARAITEPGTHAVLITHSDLGPLILGDLAGTPLLERPATHPLQLGEVRCAPLDSARSDEAQTTAE